MKKFDVVEHTADTGIVAYGNDMQEAFANAAYGMFSLMADLRQVREETSRYIEAEAGDRESLVVSWLNELLYIFDAERIVFRRFNILQVTNTRLRADAYGEKVDPSRHRLRSGVKAATYHMLKVAERKDLCSIRVIFDV
jgi:SHS2 domain-containing protein